MSVTLVTTDGRDALAHRPELAELYAAVFSEPPYNEGAEHVGRFKRWFRRETNQPGFRLVRAFSNDLLVGMAHGFTMPAGEWWDDAVAVVDTEIVDVNKFAVMEWAVASAYRRRGIGTQLMTELLRDRPEPRATLCANPQAPAHDLYLAAGWEVIGVARPKLIPEMNILTRDLPVHA